MFEILARFSFFLILILLLCVCVTYTHVHLYSMHIAWGCRQQMNECLCYPKCIIAPQCVVRQTLHSVAYSTFCGSELFKFFFLWLMGWPVCLVACVVSTAVVCRKKRSLLVQTSLTQEFEFIQIDYLLNHNVANSPLLFIRQLLLPTTLLG